MLRQSNSVENPEARGLIAGAPAGGSDTREVLALESIPDNLAFFAEAIAELDAGDGGLGLIGLVGQRDLPGVALRRAQSVLRWDRRPSLWSHAFLITGGLDGDAAAVPIREVAFHSRTGAFPEPGRNAVTDATLGHYTLRADANVALIKVAGDAEAVVARATDDVNAERLRYDLFATLGYWQAYLWTRGTRNPLEEGIPMYNASFVEFCFEAIGVDLTPAASEHNSAPEHLWNSARWWKDEFARFEHPISARYVIRDPHCGVLDP